MRPPKPPLYFTSSCVPQTTSCPYYVCRKGGFCGSQKLGMLRVGGRGSSVRILLRDTQAYREEFDAKKTEYAKAISGLGFRCL